MKKLAIVASLVAVFGSVGMAQAASAGTVTFNGQLTATTCDVLINGQAANTTVTLPTLSISQLNTTAKTAGETGFIIALNNCSGTLKTASALFESGTAVDQGTGRLKNLTGSATGVSLELLDGSSASHAVIQAGNQNQMTNTAYVDISSGSASLPYSVRYYAEAPTTAGTVASNVVYSIQYQ